ncbi:TOMM precursor leader peptide-binding protein, partial [Streptomyces sp. LaBMicrA B280]|uniref:TOMM precursor leader peptide-binding protein n=1 Tax=Streptomyces sp. LaBMicrA B280 TaxID=3391001 RepID=UPI003BA4C75F
GSRGGRQAPFPRVAGRQPEVAPDSRVVRLPDRPPRHAHSPGSGAGDPGLSLVILAPRDEVAVHAPDPRAAQSLLDSGTPHLYAGVVEGTGVVGPLVLPGETACAGCLHESRTDRDPAWPRLLAQWRSGSGSRPVGACDLALSTTVAGLAAAHALAHLDGASPSAASARWEVSLPGLNWHSRPVVAHPACRCGAAESPGEKADERPGEKPEGEHSSTPGRSRATMAVQRPSTERAREAGAARPTGTWRAHV